MIETYFLFSYRSAVFSDDFRHCDKVIAFLFEISSGIRNLPYVNALKIKELIEILCFLYGIFGA